MIGTIKDAHQLRRKSLLVCEVKADNYKLRAYNKGNRVDQKELIIINNEPLYWSVFNG